MSTWLVATRSHGKLAELVPILAERGVIAVGLHDAGIAVSADEDAIEAFDSFEANALAKARHFAQLSGMPCVADDSGLCIEALDGAPGVRSRRFASDHGHVAVSGHDEDTANNEAMLDACWDSGRAPPWRAHYACAAAFCDGTREIVVCGRTDGLVTPERDGSEGFGYDPFFFSSDLGMSFGRASREAKAAVSHRGRAFAALLDRIGS